MRLLIAIVVLISTAPTLAQQVLDPAMHHLRYGSQREWEDFPEQPEAKELRLTFSARANDAEQSIRLRHRDLRHVWDVLLNGKSIGKLPQDENEMVSLVAVPRGALHEGKNDLWVVCTEKSGEADDVSIGDVALSDRPRSDILGEASINVTVLDADAGTPLPCRLTILDSRGSMAPLGIESDTSLAVRPGVVYTGTGRAALRLPAGRYTIYAGRGFEWGIDSIEVDLRPGDNSARQLKIRREVDTSGLVASDTHIHSFTWSRHGDATLAERMITLAGEGIELPIATDHNLQIDYEEAARAAGVRGYFTPVIGNEVTTATLGHFNVFPIDKAAPLIDFRAPTWAKIFAGIDSVAPGAVVILNHARDLHGGFRPFDPSRHISITGEDLDGWELRANAMEVLNSGAILNDPLVLYRDWMGCLNRGLRLAPIGASDSHDVSRFIVGQGRTYIPVDDRDPAKIDIKAACEAIKAGRVMVSYGLLTRIIVNGRFGPGDLVKPQGDLDVQVQVQGPAWTRADRVELYANGVKLRQATIDAEAGGRPGIKWSGRWRIARPAHDLFITAIATGPGMRRLYWPGAEPYQSTGPHWTPCVLGCTGAVYVDADGSGAFDSAYAYANRLVDRAANAPQRTLTELADHDAAVGAQVASLLRSRGIIKTPEALDGLAAKATEPARQGMLVFAHEWRTSERARSATAPAH
ncbi:MAG TPA: CehA/McbA family metallohydrolase [Tepidisphaeraceae bacterium]|jgi:hypothetical protein